MKGHMHQSLLVRVQHRGMRARTAPFLGYSVWQSSKLRRFNASSRQSIETRETDLTIDQRARISRFWIPTGGITKVKNEDSHSKLIRAGFLRQAHSGIFHMLPLGRRVQDKLEALLDKHMAKLAASKLALSSISSQDLWERTNRLAQSSEIFRFEDRKDVGYLLAPTHEEEITSLVGSTAKSYKDLPVRLYQISRKYRDELRPRHGLLRSREFVMKDLYTFDYNTPRALATYDEVRKVYAGFFDELKLPYLVARADSGDMGGNLSHEFHFPTALGEDYIISCSNGCGYVANEELASSPIDAQLEAGHSLHVWRAISRDRKTLINVWHPSLMEKRTINLHAVKNLVPDFDPSVEDPLSLWLDYSTTTNSRLLLNLVDGRLPSSVRAKIEANDPELPYWPNGDRPSGVQIRSVSQNHSSQQPLNLLRIMDGDSCPECDSTLKVQKAIELGHTFHLGTRYSDPLKATVTTPVKLLDEAGSSGGALEKPLSTSTQEVPMQMGCHGIGVSRIIGAVADTLADEKGLNWPRALAPYEIIVVPGKDHEEDALEVYDTISDASGYAQRDVILDDRAESFPWKMRDADLVGYPVIIIVGRKWNSERACEVQCRRLGVSEDIPLDKVPFFVDELLAQL